MTTTTSTATRILGMNDEQTTCDACGRVELRGTVILADEDGVEVGRYGTTCAGRILGRSVTRRDAQSVEAYRRQCAVSTLRDARAAWIAGDQDAARWHVSHARRFIGLVRPDEVRMADAIDDGSYTPKA